MDDDGDDVYFIRGDDDDDAGEDDDAVFDLNGGNRGPSIDQFAFDDDAAFGPSSSSLVAPVASRPFIAIPTLSASAADQLVPYHVVAGRDPDAVRPEAAIVDGTAFHNQASLIILQYGHATQGMPAPLYDAERQCMVTKKLHYDFH